MASGTEKYYVYIVTDKDKTKLEVDVAGALSVRLGQLASESEDVAMNGNADCIHLLYWEEYANVLKALARKKELHKWSHKKKTALVNTENPEWRFLNEEVYKEVIP